jgi:hypothetical protein
MNWRDSIVQRSSRCESALAFAKFSRMLLEPAHAPSHNYGAASASLNKMKRLVKPALLLAVVGLFLFGYILNSQSGVFREFQAALLSLPWMLLVCVAIWCGTFFFLTFSLKDVPLIGLLLIVVAMYFISYAASQPVRDALVLLAGVTLGKGAKVLLKTDDKRRRPEIGHRVADGGNGSEVKEQRSVVRRPSSVLCFLVGLVLLLAFSSWWHLDMSANFYHGPRWMGLWNNPNVYGMLMSAGVVLAIGLLIQNLKSETLKAESGVQTTDDGRRRAEGRGRKWLSVVLFIAVGMMGVGLVFSYSRGAWVGTAVGLLYLAKAYGKLKWRYVMLGTGLLALGVLLLWGRTPDTAPWYVKRLDLGRPSAQHRVSAWRGAVQMMLDHPLGVGWNKTISVYGKNYSPPKGGASALTTNDYLMLGTQLGFPGLICFVTYVALCFRSPKREVRSRKAETSPHPDPLPSLQERRGNLSETLDCGLWTVDSTQVACRAGALALAVEFWFDGGLFTLATASVFWILLELGRVEPLRSADLRIGSK